MQIPHDSWLAILDEEKFLLLRNDGDEEHLELHVVRRPGAPQRAPLGRNGHRPAPGAGPRIGRTALQQTDWHALEKERFAEDLGRRLGNWARDERYDELVLAADPERLGRVRARLPEAARDRLIAEVDCDLTDLSLPAIEDAVRRYGQG